jgi:hypothetical protein
VTIAANGYLLPFYIILRGLKNIPAVFRQYPNPYPNCIVAASSSGTMDEVLMLDYSARVLHPYLNGRRGALILDSHRAHYTDNVIDALVSNNIRSVRILGGYTSFLQMLDVVFNKPLKDEYCKLWQSWFTDPKEKKVTNGGNRRKPSHAQVVGWMNQLYSTLCRSQMIQVAFTCCGLRHPSMPYLNGSQFALSLNGRLRDLLFLHGSHYDRDMLLLMISTFAFESEADLIVQIEAYMIYAKESVPTNSVSLLEDPRVVTGNPFQMTNV